MNHLKLLTVLIGLLLAPVLTHAQDNAPYVCRDANYPTPRFEFRNLPTLAAGEGWAWMADGGTLSDGVWIMDAYPDTGTALLSTSDNLFTLVGDDTTPDCEPAPVVATVATSQTACPAVAINSATNKPYCYTPQANGVVPIPPAV